MAAVVAGAAVLFSGLIFLTRALAARLGAK